MLRKIKALLFSNRDTHQTIAKNAFWLVGGETIARIIRAVIVIYSAGVLGPATFGAFSYAMAIAGLVTIFSDIGLSQILTREVARDPASRGQYFSTALLLKGVLILVNIFLVIAVAPLFTKIEAARALLPLITILIIFDTLRDFGFGLFRAMEKMEWEAITKIVMNILVAVAGFVFLLHAATARSLTIGYIIGTGVGFLLTYILLWPYIRSTFRSFNKSLVKTIIAAAWPIGLLALLGTVMINTDMVMLGWMRTAEELGFYAAAQKPILFFYILPTLLASASFPVLARLANKDNKLFREVLERGIAATFMLAIPLAIGGFILRSDIIYWIYYPHGAEYLPAAASFGILLLSLLLVFPTSMLNNSILAYNRQKSFLLFFAIGAISNVILNALLIPSYGIAGSAAATVGSQILSTALMFRAMNKINPFHSVSKAKKFMVAGIIMGTFVYLLKSLDVNFFINLLSAAILYFVLLAVMREPLLKNVRQLFKTPTQS